MTGKKRNKQSLLDLLNLNHLRKSADKVGMPPGTLLHVGEQQIEETSVRIIDYCAETVTESVIESVQDCLPYLETPTVTWINVDGLHDVKLIEELGQLFNIHTLVLEDILNTAQRPKVEEHDDHLFIVLKNLHYDPESETIREDHISVITGRNHVITFQEKPGELFKPVIERIRNKKLRIRKRQADYLTYALLDTVVDHGYAVLENIGEQIEALDAMLLEEINQEHIQAIFRLKKKVFGLRKSLRPMREVVSEFLKEDYELVDESNRIYFRDVNDHATQIIEAIEVYREVLSSMLDTYLSTLSLKMNEVMKVLTIAAAIFMPLTFIAGIYGMNFKYIPELEWKLGYFAVWGVMIILIIVMVLYFRRKKWL